MNSCRAIASAAKLGDVVRVTKELGSPTIFCRDGRFADMVMAELTGAYEAPITASSTSTPKSRRTTGASWKSR